MRTRTNPCRTIFPLLLLLLFVVMFPALVNAQEGGFIDTFDDTALPDWDHTPGVSAADGVMTINAGNFATRAGEFAPHLIAAQLRLEGDGELVLSYNTSAMGSYHLVLGEHFLLLQVERDGSLGEIGANTDINISRGEWFEVEIIIDGMMHAVVLDGVVVLEAEAPVELPAGGIAIETLGKITCAVDRIVVQGQGEQPPLGEITTPSAIENALEVSPQGLHWVRTGGPLGGLGYDVRMDPSNPDKMYVTDAYAGVFVSEDGGETWQPSNQGITVHGGISGDAIPIFCLTIDPNNINTVWAGTQFVRGIFKSTDSGKTWVEKDQGIQEGEGITFRGFAVDPNDSNIVYAAGEISSWAWAGKEMDGREFDRVKGVVYQTADGGEHWQAIWRGDNLARYIWIDPRDTNVLYLSTGIFDREAANSDPVAGTAGGVGILKSTDGGQTWQPINNGLKNLYVGSLFLHPTNPDVLLAGAGNNQYMDGNGIYLTKDGGKSWHYVLKEDNINSVEFAASDPQIAYAGSASAIYRSEDGGETWEMVSGSYDGWGAPGVRAGFPIDFQVDPRDANRIFANNYGGGNFLSEDGGRTWHVASDGYTGAQARYIAVDPTASGHVYTAARSGIFTSYDGGSHWVGLNYKPANVLEWNLIAVDPDHALHILASTNWDAGVVESNDGGKTWRRTETGQKEGYPFRAIAFAPSDPDRVYLGSGGSASAGSFANEMDGRGVYRSDDGGSTWKAVNDTVSQNAHVTGLAVDPQKPDRVFAATLNNGLLLSEDGGGSWQKIPAGLPENRQFSSVAINPQDPEQVFAGTVSAGLYVSQDGGKSWKQVAAGLNPESTISFILFNPVNPQQVFFSDLTSGVYMSTDGGQKFAPINQGLRTRAVNVMAFSGDGMHLYAATEGEGVFRLDLNGTPPPESQAVVNEVIEPEMQSEQPLEEKTPIGESGESQEKPEAGNPTKEQSPSEPVSEPASKLPCLGGLLPLILLGGLVVRKKW